MRWFVLDDADLPQEERRRLRRHRRILWALAIGLFAFGLLVERSAEGLLGDSPWRLVPTGLRLLVLLTLVGIAAQAMLRERCRALRSEQALRAASEQAARLNGALLAAATAEHEINNQLTRAVGFSELVKNHPGLAPELRPLVEEAHDGAQEAAHKIQQLRNLQRLVLKDWGADSTIDLGQSSSVPAHNTRAS